MTTLLIRRKILLLGVVLGVVALSFIGWRVSARWRVAARASGQDGLAEALNPDGSLRAGVNGSFDASGYRMEYATSGAPRFVPAAQQGACNGWDTQFGLPNGVDGFVNAVAANGNDVYVGGSFRAAGKAAANNVAKFSLTTGSWSAVGVNGNGVNGDVYTLALSGGELFVGGTFTMAAVGGANVSANNVARFNLSTGAWSPLGASASNGVSGFVDALVLSGSDLYVGGFFATANVGGPPVGVNNLAKFSFTDGNWSALGRDGNGVNNTVTTLVVSGSGDLYVGGIFTTANVGGATVGVNKIARFDTGSRAWSALGTGGGNGVGGNVYALALGVGAVYVGGQFTTANVGGSVVNANNVAKFDVATGVWSALGSGSDNGVGINGVDELVVIGSNLYAGGSFPTAGGVSAMGLAKFNMTTGVWSEVGAGVGGQVLSLAVSGSQLYVGGGISRVGANISVNNVARYHVTAGVWSALADTKNANGLGGTSLSSGNYVTTLASGGSALYAGGSFNVANVGGLSLPVNNLARFNAETGVWSALGSGGGNGVSGPPDALAAIGDDLYVGGVSVVAANVGGPTVSVNRIARFNSTTGVWSALGNGGGNGVDYPPSIAFPGPPPIIVRVYALAAIGSDLYVGGQFSVANVGGPTVSVNNVAKYNTATGVWSALGNGGGNGVGGLGGGVVRALAVSGTDLYVGGLFTAANVGGPPVNVDNMAKYDTLTGTWSAFGNSLGGTVRALAVGGGNLYAGGDFDALLVGNLVVGAANRVAKLDLATGIWSALGSGGGNGVNDTVTALAVSGNTLYVGGEFTTANVGGPTVSVNKVARYRTLTGDWSALSDSGGGNGVSGNAHGIFDNNVAALALVGQGLYVGGDFLFAGDNKVSSRLGRYCLSNAPPTVTTIGNVVGVAASPGAISQIATINDFDQPANTLSVSVNGGTSATVNGVTISNLTVDASGKVSANIAAAANATPANFTLRVTDNEGLFAEAALAVAVVRFSGSVSDPLVCTGPGNTVSATLVLGNPSGTPLSVSNTTTFTNLAGVPDSCTVTPNVGTCTVTNASLRYTATLAANQTVTIAYLTQVAGNVAPGAQVCANNIASFSRNAGIIGSNGIFLDESTVSVVACGTVNCPAVGPGVLPRSVSPMNDQKAGSVLVYNIYTSATDPTQQNTRLAITNTDPARQANVHLFFMDGASCSVADSFLCLTPNQTTSFLASDLDPGTTGYLVAVATDAAGCPINFNSLIGDEFVKFQSGHAANLGAEAITAIAGGLPFCNQNSSTAQLNFDGVSYNVVPRVLALDNVLSRADGNDTMLVLNRIGGNLGTGAATLGTIFGILYDDAEVSVSFSLTGGCQLRGSLTNSFPRTAPRFENFVPAGRTGWLKLYSQSTDIGITGAAINFNPNAGAGAGAFNQGHNLHALTNSGGMVYTIPVFPPGC